MVVMGGVGPVLQCCGVRVAPLPSDGREARLEDGERHSQPECVGQPEFSNRFHRERRSGSGGKSRLEGMKRRENCCQDFRRADRFW
jgi:hypothetical protein